MNHGDDDDDDDDDDDGYGDGDGGVGGVGGVGGRDVVRTKLTWTSAASGTSWSLWTSHSL